MTTTVDRHYALETLQGLVRINSINPSLAPGGAGEAESAAFIAASLGGFGARVAVQVAVQVARHEPALGRASVVGVLKGAGGGRSLMFNAHVDTVGVEGMAEPFSGALREGGCMGAAPTK